MPKSMMSSARFLLSLLVLQLVSNASANWSLLGNFDPGRGGDQDRQAAMDAWANKQHSVQLLFTTWDQVSLSLLISLRLLSRSYLSNLFVFLFSRKPPGCGVK